MGVPMKALGCLLGALALPGISPCVSAADPGPTWKVDSPADDLAADSKTHISLCLGVAEQAMPEGTDRTRVTVDIHTDRSGRAIDVAVVESSGIEELDRRVRACFRDARFTPAAKGTAGYYRLVRMELARKPYEPPARCAVGMHTDVTIGLRPLESITAVEMPAGSEAIVCGCLIDVAQGPTPPVILGTSGFPRVDQGAIELMTQAALERWTIPFGCTAWKVRIDR
jgi:TonB family protein